MSRLDHEESPAWGKGIDYFEIAKGLARDQAENLPRGYADVLCDICHTWVNELDSDKILDTVVCAPCFEMVHADLDQEDYQ